MKKTYIMFFILIVFSYISLPGVENNGHISYIEGDVTIVKTNGDMLMGKVNYPLITSDVIMTGKIGRCEIQFPNGTIMRLDNNTHLKLISSMIESVTSKKKISTLKLMKGSIYSMNQIYKHEILQVISPEISVKMDNRSTNVIKTSEEGSSVRVFRGKIGVLYGNRSKTYLKSGKNMIFPRKGKKHVSRNKKDNEFVSWNRSINKNFKKLHYGKSKVPDVIYIHSPGIVHFAEKWSTLYGEWEYNELFGYVWIPYDDTFQGNRPFFDANYVRINGELVLIPNQAWGWAPVHMGTWFWSTKQGWLWIPGNGEIENMNQVPALYSAFMLQFFNWSSINYGIDDLFTEYANNSWNNNYYLTNIPEQNEIGQNSTGSGSDDSSGKIISLKIISPGIKEANTTGVGSKLKSESGSKFSDKRDISIKRDWNPDSRLFRRVGIKIVYDSENNLVKFAGLNISTGIITGGQKLALKKSIFYSGFLRSSHSNSSVPGGTGTTNYSDSNSSGFVSSGSGTTIGGRRD